MRRKGRKTPRHLPSFLGRAAANNVLARTLKSQRILGENRRERFVFRDREYRLRPSEGESLRDLGTFRLIREDDLVRGVYSGNAQLAEADLRSLRRQGLVRSITFQSLGDRPIRVHTLTGEGYHFALSRREGPPQFYYWGVVKPSEVKHDSLLYRATSMRAVGLVNWAVLSSGSFSTTNSSENSIHASTNPECRIERRRPSP